MKKDIMVSVLCPTYNHEAFIGDAIEGVLSQKTEFKYELIIHEDASTDRTAEIVKEYADRYPELIRVIWQKENQFSKYDIMGKYMMPLVRGRYFALCEGDDYWTDDRKLQKQIDFLESHQDYSMCMHNAVKLYMRTGEKVLLDTFPRDGTYSQEEQIKAGLGSDFPATASYVFRTDLYLEMPSFFSEPRIIDYFLRQYYASRGKVYYFQKPMSVYRVMVPNSYKTKTVENQAFCNEHTINTIRFMEKLDVYTEGKYHELLEGKTESDYFGYCTSIDKEAGIKKALERDMNLERIQKCYDCLDVLRLSSSVIEISLASENLFIYGTSRLAMICRQQMENAGVEFKGFVVSDGQIGPKILEGKKIYHLQEVIDRFRNPGFILAVQPVNADVIAEYLEEKHMVNYCMPYRLEKER